MTMRQMISLALTCVFLSTAATTSAQDNPRLEDLADRYWEMTLERSPMWATALGDYRYNDRLDDLSERGRKESQTGLKNSLAELHRLPATDLSADDRLTRDLLDRALRDSLLKLRLPRQFMPLDPLYGAHIRFPLILVSQPFRDKADFDAYLSRLRGFPKQVTDIIANMREGMARGIVMPRVVVERVIPQIRVHIVRDPKQSEFYTPVSKLGALDEPDREAVALALENAIASDVVPAYLQLLAFVEDVYLPRARSTVGFGDLPNGDRLYQARIYLHTTLQMSVDEIHGLGLTEVARIRAEMTKIMGEVGHKGSLDEFIAHLRTDPSQRFESGDELLASANAILKRVRPLLPRLFGRLPKTDCIVKEIESHRAVSSPVAWYNLAPADGARPAYFYVNTHAPAQRVRFTLETLAYHEAIPGHHLQMALDQENTSLPTFRRYLQFDAYWEGWALYAEKLGYELGGFTDPYQKFGQLTYEIVRACRLVIDTGIHAKGWSRERAIEYMAANAALSRLDIETEVDRYIIWPGQALAYKIGELRLLEIRREAERALGDRFDIRAFHDALLAGGAMPLDLLEIHMSEWIAAQEK